MKRALLLIATVAVTSVAMADDWKEPVYSGTYTSIEDVTGTTAYIYNVDAKKFLGEGNEYGTHATLGLTGNIVTLEKAYSDDLNGDGVINESDWDGKSYTITNYSTKKGGNYKMFFTDGGHIYVDASSKATDLYFAFNSIGSNTYTISGSSMNGTWNSSGEMEGYLVGCYTGYINNSNSTETGTGVIYDYYGAENNYAEGTFLTNWTFVSVENYEAFQEQVKTYEAAKELGSRLQHALDEGLTESDITNERAVYNNTSSSIDDIEAAITSINNKILAYYETSVTPTNPKVILIDDCADAPTWTNGAGAKTFNTADWIGDDWDEGFIGKHLNIWDASLQGKIYQTFTDLPNGIYSVTMGILSQNVEAQAYANNNSVVVAGDNKGHMYKILTEVTDGTLEYGFYQEESATNWVVIDQAKTEYYGSGFEAYKYWAQQVIENVPDFSEKPVMKALVTEFETASKDIEKATTKQEVLNQLAAVETLVNTINKNMNAYEALNNLIKDADTLGESEYMNTYYGEKLSDASQENGNIIDEKELDTEAVNAAYGPFKTLYDEAQNYVWNVEKLASAITESSSVYAEYGSQCSAEASIAYGNFISEYEKTDFSNLKNSDIEGLISDFNTILFNLQVPATPASDDNPVDYTAKIYNPSYSVGAEGWTNEGWSTCANNTGWWGFATVEEALADQYYLNLWNTTTGNVYQTLENLPNGTYSVKVGAYADKAGFQVYANDAVADVKVGQTENNERGEWYEMIVEITDGTLTIGARNTVDAENWDMIDNWKLTYYGTNSEKTPTDISEIANATKQTAVYSISGVKVGNSLNGLKKGIYVKDGKKFIVK